MQPLKLCFPPTLPPSLLQEESRHWAVLFPLLSPQSTKFPVPRMNSESIYLRSQCGSSLFLKCLEASGSASRSHRPWCLCVGLERRLQSYGAAQAWSGEDLCRVPVLLPFGSGSHSPWRLPPFHTWQQHPDSHDQLPMWRGYSRSGRNESALKLLF